MGVLESEWVCLGGVYFLFLKVNDFFEPQPSVIASSASAVDLSPPQQLTQTSVILKRGK